MIQSFDRANLLHAQRYAHDTPGALLVEKEADLKAALEDDWPALHVSHELLNESLVKCLHDEGRTIGVWTPNTRDQLLRSFALDVDRIITDEPMMAMALFDRVRIQSS